MTLAWHYTDGTGLIGIYENKCIWATQIQYLNDRNEYLYVYQIAARQVRDLYEFREGWAVTSPKLAKAIEDQLVAVATGHDLGSLPSIFVTSFSTAMNSLSQWRAYGGGTGNAYAVGVNTDALTRLAVRRGWRYEECRYGEAAVFPEVYAAIVETVRRYESGEWTDTEDPEKEALSTLVEALIDVAAIVKDEGFKEESEYRLVSPRIPVQDIKFRTGASTLRPYVEFDLSENGFAVGQPLGGVGIGPGPSQNLATAAASALQVKANDAGGAACYPSSIPYRSI